MRGIGENIMTEIEKETKKEPICLKYEPHICKKCKKRGY